MLTFSVYYYEYDFLYIFKQFIISEQNFAIIKLIGGFHLIRRIDFLEIFQKNQHKTECIC